MADIDNIRKERELKKEINLIFDLLMVEVVRKLLQDDQKKTELDIDMALSIFTGAAVFKLYTDAIMNKAIQAAQSGSNKAIYQTKQAGRNLQYKTISPQTRQLIENSVFNASQNTLNRLKGDIKQVLLDGYDEGKGTKDIAKDIRDQFNYMKQYEAERIARTEINSFHNQGGFIVKRESNIEYHMWVTSEDERVRSSHRNIDGQIVRVGDPFSNGLRYPGDRSGDIKEWINCRCIARAYFMPPGAIAPLNKKYFYESDIIRPKR